MEIESLVVEVFVDLLSSISSHDDSLVLGGHSSKKR